MPNDFYPAVFQVAEDPVRIPFGGAVNNNLELIHPSAPHQLKTDPLGLVPAPFWLGCFELASAVGQLLRLKRILPSGGHSAKVTGDVNLTG